MMSSEEIKEKLKVILDKNLGDSEVEDILLEIQADYDNKSETEGSDSTENEDYKSKYKELHQKYIDRFFGSSKIENNSDEEIVNEEYVENENSEEIEDIKYDDLFEEEQ